MAILRLSQDTQSHCQPPTSITSQTPGKKPWALQLGKVKGRTWETRGWLTAGVTVRGAYLQIPVDNVLLVTVVHG